MTAPWAVRWPTALALAVMLASCGPQPTTSTSRDPGGRGGALTGSVEGQVTLEDAEDSTGVLVFCAGTDRQAFTDREGRFAFSNLALDTFEIFARHDGYQQTSLAVVTLSAEAPRAVLAAVTLERASAAVMDLPSPSRGTLRGRALRAGSSVHDGIEVSLQGTSHSVRTGADGRWALRRIEPGEYVVAFRTEGHVPGSARVTVLPSAQVEVPSVVLTPSTAAPEVGKSIVGVVAMIAPDGGLTDDFANVLVVLEGTGHTAAPDPDGYFQMTGLGPGVYRLSARADGYQAGDPVIVDLRTEQMYEATVFLESEGAANDEAPGEVTGRLAVPDGGAAPGATIGVVDTSLTSITGRGGQFTIDSVPPGTVTLVAQAEGYEVIEIDRVRVRSGETTDIGTVTLQRLVEPPRVISTDPADGARDVLVESQVPVFIRFSAPMDVASVRRALDLSPRISYNAYMGREHPETDYDLMLLLIPSGIDGLDFRDRVRIRVGRDARSEEGVALDETFEMRFAMGRPALLSSIPRNGEPAHPSQQPVTLRFNAVLRAEDIENAFSFTPNPPTLPNVQIARDRDTGWTIVNLSTHFSPDTDYRLRISSSLRTESGQRLGGRTEVRFRTAPQFVIDHRGEPAPRDDSVIY